MQRPADTVRAQRLDRVARALFRRLRHREDLEALHLDLRGLHERRRASVEVAQQRERALEIAAQERAVGAVQHELEAERSLAAPVVLAQQPPRHAEVALGGRRGAARERALAGREVQPYGRDAQVLADVREAAIQVLHDRRRAARPLRLGRASEQQARHLVVELRARVLGQEGLRGLADPAVHEAEAARAWGDQSGVGEREQPRLEVAALEVSELREHVDVELVAHAARELDQRARDGVEAADLLGHQRDRAVRDVGRRDPVGIPAPALAAPVRQQTLCVDVLDELPHQ
jgi:hypothetical protein